MAQMLGGSEAGATGGDGLEVADPAMLERLEFVGRLRHVMRGMSARELARHSGIPRGTVQNILTGRTDAGRSQAVRLAQALKVPVGWLVAGETPDDAVLGQHLRRLIGAERDRTVPPVGAFVLQRGGRALRVTSRRLSDVPALRTEWVEHGLQVDPDRLVVLQVEGDGMAPRARQGDFVLIDLGVEQVGDTGFYALVSPAGELVLRRIEVQTKAIFMTSGDRSYQEVLEFADAENLVVAGKAVAVLARL